MFFFLFLFLFANRLGRRFRRLRRRGGAVGRVVFFEVDCIFGFGLRSSVQAIGRLIEGLFGHPEGIHCRRHAAVKDHLSDYLGYLFAGDADV